MIKCDVCGPCAAHIYKSAIGRLIKGTEPTRLPRESADYIICAIRTYSVCIGCVSVVIAINGAALGNHGLIEQVIAESPSAHVDVVEVKLTAKEGAVADL